MTKEQQAALDLLYNTYSPLGYDIASIAGIAGNGLVESGLNPDSVSASNTYHGAWQNHKNIRKAIESMYGDYSMNSQMKFIDDWNNRADNIMKGNYSAYTSTNAGKYKKGGYKTARDAADAFMRYYERPVIMKDGKVVGYQKANERYANAEAAYKYLYDKYGSPEITEYNLPDGGKRMIFKPRQVDVQQSDAVAVQKPTVITPVKRAQPIVQVQKTLPETVITGRRIQPLSSQFSAELPSLDDMFDLGGPEDQFKQYVADALGVPNMHLNMPSFKKGKPDLSKELDNPASYTVTRGDSLSKIAKQYTGDPMRYMEIARLNEIANPDLIQEGSNLLIPQNWLTKTIEKDLPEIVVTGRKYKNQLKRLAPPQKADIPELTNSVYVSPLHNSTSTIEQLNSPGLFQTAYNKVASKFGDIVDTLEENKGDVEGLLQTAWNGVAKHFTQDPEVKTKKLTLSPVVKKQKDVLDESFAKASRVNGDTLTWDVAPIDKTGNKYYIESSYPITDDMRFGARNRGEYRDLDSNNAPLTTYNPIYKYEDYVKGVDYNGKKYTALDKDGEGHQNHFMGFDSNGKFKIGPLSEFGPGDTLTQVYYKDIIDIPRDGNGNIIYKEDIPNNPGRFQPVVNVYDEGVYDQNGVVQQGKRGYGVITTMTQKRSLNGNYGNVSGGRVLLVAGNEKRIVEGTINHVIQEIEMMKRNHKGKLIRYYELDNGSYNRGLRTRNGENISAQDLVDYDRQNTRAAKGGHFMYIRNR